jgi:uncharacterized protein (DUF2249 family)
MSDPNRDTLDEIHKKVKVYKGTCTKDGMDWEVTVDGKPLPQRQDLRNHSPDGFSWGYGGSGCAQLALALLADLTDDDIAARYYQDFKWVFVAKLSQDECWEATCADLFYILHQVITDRGQK